MFLRAEDVFGYTLRAAKLQKEAAEAMSLGFEAARVADQEVDPGGDSGPAATGADHLKRKIRSKYLSDPVAKSHGETFLEMLQDRLGPHGLYFLDEPEAPMSPTRVLALLSLIRERAKRDCQFVMPHIRRF
jgi:predicted ATPase